MDSYHIGIDEDEVLSSAFFGNDGFPTAEAARQHFETYTPDMQRDFRIYRITIAPVIDTSHDDYRIEVMTREEGMKHLDEHARATFGMSGEEFIQRWRDGSGFHGTEDDVMDVSMWLPFAGINPKTGEREPD